ncbi:NAD(P)H-hydrate epimerase [Spirochaeta africana]|uniref:NAD(P)H-hydrate epimerase n=1 Tax=Spirochaeta africana (strain ATCC 700263 / DSM 8902 / Z-7692) TaxID=889378 RepID=H9UH84_SPIAZ|nr:NAD(P)H-hydrate epimerase [Spirochaeta africana]AFG36877.1 yjeF-like protein [Spirochaeta africana DSM 8902]
MQYLAAAARKQQLDRTVQEQCGFPSIVLMEQAARSCWEIIRGLEVSTPQPRLVVAVGPGNNGGDGMAIARLAAHHGWLVTLLHTGSAWKPVPQQQLEMLRAYPAVRWLQWELRAEESSRALADADVVVDAVFGVGLTREPAGTYAEILAEINRQRSRKQAQTVVAIDVPSGLSHELLSAADGSICCVQADCTAAVLPIDSLLYMPAARRYAGRICPADAGFPPEQLQQYREAELVELQDLPEWRVSLAADAYKGSRGHACIYAGSSRYHGAAVLAALAAGCGPAGRVTLSVDPSIDQVVRTRLLSCVVQSSEQDPPAGTTAVLAGPGWDTISGRGERLQQLLALGLPTVLDGDALTLLPDFPDPAGDTGQVVQRVLTPHPGELSRLVGAPVPRVLRDTARIARDAARRYYAVVVAKGHVTWICHPDGRMYVVDGMEPRLAIAGSGDVLAGCIAAELAADADPLRAALAGVLRHRAAGGAARDTGIAAEQLIELLRRGS